MNITNGCQYISDIDQFIEDVNTSVSFGHISKIVAKTPIGIEWESSLKGCWFMPIYWVKTCLICNWDGISVVHLFFDANFIDGSRSRAHIVISSTVMKEIQKYLIFLEA